MKTKPRTIKAIEKYGDRGRYWIYTKRKLAEIQKEKDDKIIKVEIKII